MKSSFLTLAALFGLTVVAPLGAATATFTDDFGAWTHSNVGFGTWLEVGNSDSLKWNLTTIAGAGSRTSSFSYTSPQAITQVEFDWRFANDNFDARLAFKLFDGEGSLLFNMSADTPHGGGVIKPVFHDVISIPAGTAGLVFVYEQLPTDPIYGKPAFFDSSNIDDWDAMVDSVTLTIVPEPSIGVLGLGAAVLLCRSRRCRMRVG